MLNVCCCAKNLIKLRPQLRYAMQDQDPHPLIKRMTLLAVFLIMKCFSFASSASSSPAVIIIGAGMSGILAAKTLHDAGIPDFIILEATNKIGGRIRKAEFGGHTVEKGANWLQYGGPRPSPVSDIAKHINITRHFSDYTNISSNTYKQGGGLYPEHEVEAALEAGEIMLHLSTNLSKSLSSTAEKDEDNDLSIEASQLLYRFVPRTPLEILVDYFYNDYEHGERPRLTSLKHTLPNYEFEDFGYMSYFVADPRGLESVVDHIAKQFLFHKNGAFEDPRLKLNKVVRKIGYSRGGVTVITEDELVYQAKYVIVSVSLGVLQSDLIEFRPKLPQWKSVAISEFSMTAYAKIFLKFPYRFWPCGPGTELFLYAHERRGYYPIWQHLENEMPGSNILFVLATDEEARRIEQQQDQQTQIEVMEVLKEMFGKDIPIPQDILVNKWLSNKFFQGSYSNWPARYSEHRHQQLKEAVGPIHFTGEHTNAKYLGYVEGAYYAGIETANNVIKCLQKLSVEG